MKLLMHVCCAPCFCYPYFDLSLNKDIKLTGYFYNPNIQPEAEFNNRLDSLKKFAGENKIDIYTVSRSHGVAVSREDPVSRCSYCYENRLRKTAQKAIEENADAFSTTLLISPYQKHDIIIDICKNLANEYGIDFYYKDWRPFYRKGVELSKEKKLYRQKYCGCLYSIKN